ncbi:PAS domain S-box protein [Rubellimicrobium arenae]|uniref:PAS domain S-box protein n=1 Tax=Rubellimicrobium arenae TaxID=2817372 RepID=UPI001B309622|nr:PAS domain S-box protein [Rubellimicrobium arenae]
MPALVGIMLLVAALLFAVLNGGSSRLDAERDRLRGVAVLIEAQRMLSAYQDADAGQRGYLLTGSAEDLRNYRQGRARVDSHLGRMWSLTRGDPVRRASIADLRVTVARGLGPLSQADVLDQQGRHEEALALRRTDESRRAMDGVRATVDRLVQDEERLIEERSLRPAGADGRWQPLLQASVPTGLALLGVAVALAMTRGRARRRNDDQAEALKQSEEFSRRILAASPDAIGVMALDGRLEFLSDSGRIRLARGDHANPLHGADWQSFLSEEDRSRAHQAMADAQAGRVGRFVMAAPGRSGSPGRWLDVTLNAVPGPDGRPEKILSVARDITAQVQGDLQRQVVETRMRAILDTAVDAIVVIDDRGCIQSINPAAERIFGYRAHEAIGQNVRLLMPPSQAAQHDGFLQAYLRTGDRKIIGIGRTVEGRRRDGSTFPLDLSIAEWRDVDGQRFFTGIMRDVSARQEAERRLQASEMRFRQLAETIHDVFYVLEIDELRLSYISPAFETVHGRPREDVLADPLTYRSVIHPDDRAKTQDALARQRQGENTVTEYRILRPDGELRHIVDRAFVTREPSTGASRVVGVAEDVTERKRVEEELRHLNETLEEQVTRAVAERARAAAQLHEMQKLDTIGHLTGGVAHDFNNLLTPIVGSLERAHRKLVGDERAQRLVAGGLEAAERARLLVSRLLAFARRTHLEARPVDVAVLLDGMADLIRRTIGPQIAVMVNAEQDLPPARVDPNQLELALLNLSVNARDAMPGGGQLRITVSLGEVEAGQGSGLAPGRYVRLAVIDTGTGMDAETLQRCIEPFFSTKGVGKGTGLGLSMVHGLAAQSGGQLVIQSEPGQGTRAEIWLPEAEREAATPVLTPTAEVVRAPWAARVLLVDDEEVVRTSVAEMLRDLGYEVHEATSGRHALDLLADGLRVDMVVTDYLMPGITGTDLVAGLRRERPDLPALLITGYADAEAISRVAKGVARIAKPFSQAQLGARVDQVLRGQGGPDRSRSRPLRIVEGG